MISRVPVLFSAPALIWSCGLSLITTRNWSVRFFRWFTRLRLQEEAARQVASEQQIGQGSGKGVAALANLGMGYAPVGGGDAWDVRWLGATLTHPATNPERYSHQSLRLLKNWQTVSKTFTILQNWQTIGKPYIIIWNRRTNWRNRKNARTEVQDC